ncbi:MAG: prepilin-type N-terminal cleavage/methylation domain-containing protein [Mariprofundaceae bacterium]
MKWHENGFTIIESLVALVIISIAMLALGSLLIGNIKSTMQSEHRIDHSGLAQSAMTNMVSLVKSGGVGYTEATAQAALTSQMANITDINATVTLNPTPTLEGITVVTVQLNWTIRDDPKTLTLLSAVTSE